MSTGKRHILVLTYWPFNEGLIQAYTIPYLRIIRKVSGARITLVTLEQDVSAPQIISEGIEHLPVEIGFFSFTKIFRWMRIVRQLKKFCRKESVTGLHSWCTPGGAIAWMLSRRTGLPFVADSYEPHADAMVENGTWEKDSSRFKLMFWLEKKITFSAQHLISVSPFMKDYAANRYGLRNKPMFVKPACTDLGRFVPSKNDLVSEEGKITGIYVGKLGGIYFEDEVFDFIGTCANFWGKRFRFRLVGNYSDEYISMQCQRAGIGREIIEHGAVPHHAVPGLLANASFGITPVKPVPTKKCCTPVKDGEYWACGLPVVITRDISVDSNLIAENDCGAILQEMNHENYIKAVSKIDSLLRTDNAQLKERCRSLAVNHRNFIIAEDIYRKIYT